MARLTMREEVHTADGSPQAGDHPLHDKVDGAPGLVDSTEFNTRPTQVSQTPTALTSESITTAASQLQAGLKAGLNCNPGVSPYQEAEAQPRSNNVYVSGSSKDVLQDTGHLACECQKSSHRHERATVDLIQHSDSDAPSDQLEAPWSQTSGCGQRLFTNPTMAESSPIMRSGGSQCAKEPSTRFISEDTDQQTSRCYSSASQDDNCSGVQQPLGEASLSDRPTPPLSTLTSPTAWSCSSSAPPPAFGRRGQRHVSMQQRSDAAWMSSPDIPSGHPLFSAHQTRYSHLRRSRSLPSSLYSRPECFAQHDGERDEVSFEQVAVEEYTLVSGEPSPGCKDGSLRPSYSATSSAVNGSPASAFTDPHPSLLRPPVTRSRGKSLLSPVQLHVLRRKLEAKTVSINDSGFNKGALGYLGQKISKGGKQRISDNLDGFNRSNITAHSSKTRSEQGKKQSSLTNSTPVLVFQPHDTEISTGRSSVSGRLILLVPQVHGQKFQFVSLALHLRLKESITWTRQDLTSFEIEKEHWAQTIWEKKVMLPFQDRQVEEGQKHGCSPYTGLSSAAAIAAAVTAASEADKTIHKTSTVPTISSPVSSTDRLSPHVANMEFRSSSSTNHRSASDVNRDGHAESLSLDSSAPTMDEWRWEWLIPVTKNGARPESFEGAMGMVWYELEAKCLFRWDNIDENGQINSEGNTHWTAQAVDGPNTLKSPNRGGSKGPAKSQLGSFKLLKGLGATTNTAKSIANVFGKFKAGNKDRPETKEKKTLYAVGDFVLGTQHDEYMRDSIKKAQQAATAAAAALTKGLDGDHNDVKNTALLSGQHHKNSDGMDNSGETRPTALSGIPEPIPFLVRKIIKLHFSRPPRGPSSRAGYFLPPPSMSLPTLPSTRRLKAIIPGAKIQVQIQVPSIIPIPGYAQTSLLVPSSKTGGLVSKAKRCDGGGDPGLLGTGTAFRDQYIGQHVSKDAKMNRPPTRLDPRYPDSFQVALTIRKVTKHDINRSDILRRRYENAEVAAKTLAKHTNSCNTEDSGPQGLPRTRLLSGTCTKFTQPKSAYTPGSGTLPCERKVDDGATCTNLDCKRKDEVRETAGKVCRREIRVRKIECEFWQKESCRIPTDEAPSRSVKFPLAPVFIYSEKEQEKERVGGMVAYHQNPAQYSPFDSTDGTASKLAPPQGLAMSTTHNYYDDGGLSTPISPAANNTTTTDCSHTPSPLKPPPPFNAGERIGSLGSIFSTSLQRSACSSPAMRPTSVILTSSSTSPSPATNHPFMLLIPVPLDSPKLRQTYDWPSSEMPSPILPSAYDYAMPGSLISETGLGLGSELDATSQSTTQDAGETASCGVNGYTSPTLPNASTVKARIVVKHHLSFRLSIDVLEYEGEYDQEDMDLEAIEEQQLQRARSRQAISVGSHSVPIANFDLGLSGLKGNCSTPEEKTGARGGAEEQHATVADAKFASGISLPRFERTGVNKSHGNSDQHHLQPALSFFNSAAGLLDLDEDDGRPLQEPALLGLPCALPAQRRGSQGSLGTVGSNYSSNSGTATSASFVRAQTCISVSGTSSGGSSVLNPLADVSSESGGGGGSGGLMAGAIGVLKKKASFSGLAHALGTTSTSIATHPLQPRQQPSQASINQNRAVVRKLKDFVIRVPITVVIQVDEQGRASGAYGTTGSCSNVRCENIDLGQKDVANTLPRQSNAAHEEISVPATSSTSHWRGALWREQGNDQQRVNLENADEDFDEDFIVVDAEEVD